MAIFNSYVKLPEGIHSKSLWRVPTEDDNGDMRFAGEISTDKNDRQHSGH
jgi:hypothetical protein